MLGKLLLKKHVITIKKRKDWSRCLHFGKSGCCRARSVGAHGVRILRLVHGALGTGRHICVRGGCFDVVSKKKSERCCSGQFQTCKAHPEGNIIYLTPRVYLHHKFGSEPGSEVYFWRPTGCTLLGRMHILKFMHFELASLNHKFKSSPA